MKVEVRIYKNQHAGDGTVSSGILANCSICLDGELVINGFRVIDGRNGRFVSFPQENRNGKFYNTCYCLTKKGRESLSQKIMDAYESEDGEKKEGKNKEEADHFMNVDDGEKLPFE